MVGLSRPSTRKAAELKPGSIHSLRRILRRCYRVQWETLVSSRVSPQIRSGVGRALLACACKDRAQLVAASRARPIFIRGVRDRVEARSATKFVDAGR